MSKASEKAKAKAKEHIFHFLDTAVRATTGEQEALSNFTKVRSLVATHNLSLFDCHPNVKVQSDPDGVANDLRETILSMEDEAVSLRHIVATKDSTIAHLRSVIDGLNINQGRLMALLKDVVAREDLYVEEEDEEEARADDAALEAEIVAAIAVGQDLYQQAIAPIEVVAPDAAPVAREAAQEPVQAACVALARYRAPGPNIARMTAVARAEGCSIDTLRTIFTHRTGSAQSWMLRLSSRSGIALATVRSWRDEGFVSAANVRAVIEGLDAFGEPVNPVESRRRYRAEERDRKRVASMLFSLGDEVVRSRTEDLRDMVFSKYGETFSLATIASAQSRIVQAA